jgi:hypothetical protein
MLSYRPPKGSCWGHVIRPKDPLGAKQKVNAFFEAYFQRLEPEWDPTRQLTFALSWKTSALPKSDWPEEFLKPENEKWQRVLFILTGDRVMFPGGLLIPISPMESASYVFLSRFSTDAPFKMSPKHFQVGILGKTGKLAWRKPDADIAARLQEVLV